LRTNTFSATYGAIYRRYPTARHLRCRGRTAAVSDWPHPRIFCRWTEPSGGLGICLAASRKIEWKQDAEDSSALRRAASCVEFIKLSTDFGRATRGDANAQNLRRRCAILTSNRW